ncbi:MAG: hypothetical protein WBM07_17990, partial [Chitinivibrionales bacterium]
MNPLKFLTVALGSVLLCLSCSVQHLAGGGTGEETTNGFVATILYQDGTPAINASVKLRPSTYLMDTAVTAGSRSPSIIDTTTDSLGRFAIANVDSGDYVIEVLDKTQSEGLVFRGSAAKGRLTDWGITFLNPVGTVAGTVNFGQAPQGTIVYVQVYGLDRVEKTNPESGNFTLRNIAAGNYSLRVFPSSTTYLPLTVENVPVASG